MAKGMVESTTMLIGDQPDLDFITFGAGRRTGRFDSKGRKKTERGAGKGRRHHYDGYSPTEHLNGVSRLMEHYKFRHLTGMNLPMVIDVVSQLGEDADADVLCEGTLEPSKDAIIDVNAWMKELGILE